MKNSKDLILYSLIVLLGLGLIASGIALISKNKALQSSASSVSELKELTQQDGQKTEQPTQQEVEELRTTIREKTFATLDNRISQAKTEYEVGLFNEMKQKYTNDIRPKRKIQDRRRRRKNRNQKLNRRRMACIRPAIPGLQHLSVAITRQRIRHKGYRSIHETRRRNTGRFQQGKTARIIRNRV